MLTATQYDRLPGTARAIVDTDRAIATITDRVVTPFDPAQRTELRELRADRRVLTTAAHNTWGKPLRSDGTARA